MTDMLGLREQKKAATRRAIAFAALDLVAVKGLDGTTVEEIARTAGVSVRSFHNYFPSREAAILDIAQQMLDHMLSRLEAAPVTEPFWDSLTDALIATVFEVEGVTVERVGVLLRVLGCEPRVKEISDAPLQDQALERILAVFAHRPESTALDPIYPVLAIEMGLETVRVALQLHVDDDLPESLAGIAQRPLRQLLRDALTMVGSGFRMTNLAAPPQFSPSHDQRQES